MPTNTAIPLSGLGKGPNQTPKLREAASRTACRISSARLATCFGLPTNVSVTLARTATKIGTESNGAISPKLPVM
jgi:hypothetical protein